MLVLTRKISQQIQIGDGVVITVLQVNGNSVRIGIEAPREVRVVRGELGLKNEQAPAAVSATSQIRPEEKSRRPEDRKLSVFGRTFAKPAVESDRRQAPVERAERNVGETKVPSVRPSQRLAANALHGFMMPRR